MRSWEKDLCCFLFSFLREVIPGQQLRLLETDLELERLFKARLSPSLSAEDTVIQRGKVATQLVRSQDKTNTHVSDPQASFPFLIIPFGPLS